MNDRSFDKIILFGIFFCQIQFGTKRHWYKSTDVSRELSSHDIVVCLHSHLLSEIGKCAPRERSSFATFGLDPKSVEFVLLLLLCCREIGNKTSSQFGLRNAKVRRRMFFCGFGLNVLTCIVDD